jgi:integrase
VPLWWDAGTLTDLAEWQAERLRHGDGGGDPFVCSVLAHRRGQSIQRAAIRRRFLSACKVLGLARLRTLTIHHGRHTFISHALAGGRTLAEVRAAAGHSNVAITSGYLHVIVEEDEGVGELFAVRYKSN